MRGVMGLVWGTAIRAGVPGDARGVAGHQPDRHMAQKQLTQQSPSPLGDVGGECGDVATRCCPQQFSFLLLSLCCMKSQSTAWVCPPARSAGFWLFSRVIMCLLKVEKLGGEQGGGGEWNPNFPVCSQDLSLSWALQPCPQIWTRLFFKSTPQRQECWGLSPSGTAPEWALQILL